MASESTATTVWEGTLERGRGETTAASGTLSSVEVTWQARVERTEGTTSPEELLAAAHAACYCMGLAHELVKSSHLTVSGRVPGIDQEAFEGFARAAGEGCPISGALKGNVDIEVEATLEG